MEKIIELLNNNKIDSAYNILKKKSKLNEYILDKNNLIHICAIRGKEEILNLLEDKKIDKFLSNGRGDNILHLLLKNGWDIMAITITKLYPELLDYINFYKVYPISNCIDRIDILIKLIEIIIKNKYTDQINVSDINGTTFVNKIISQKNKNLNLFELIEPYIDFNLPKSNPVLIHTILTKQIELAKRFIKKDKGINIPNLFYLYPIHAALSIESEELIELMLKSKSFKSELLDYGGLQNNYLPLNMCLKFIQTNGVKQKYINLTKMILNKITKFSAIDMNKNTYGHNAIQLKYKLKNKKDKNLNELLKMLEKIIKNSDKDYKNLEGITINFIEKNKKTSLKCEINENNKIIFPETIFKSNNGLFNSDLIHNMMYFIYILRKYDSATMPIIKLSETVRKEANNILAKLQFQEIDYDPYYTGLREIIKIGYELFPEMMPTIILWKDKNLHWFDPHFDEVIKNHLNGTHNEKKRFIIIKVSYLVRPESLHANVIIFDKKDNSYRRFEPYGSISTDDEMYLDKLVMDVFLKYKKMKIKYYKPGDFLEKGRFQAISNDSVIDVKKTGDPLGYCLAWCLWYIELKLNNTSLSENELIEQAAEKIYVTYCNSNSPYIDFIRDYSRKLNDEKDKLFEEFGIDPNNFYNIAYDNNDLNMITEGVTHIIEKFI